MGFVPRFAYLYTGYAQVHCALLVISWDVVFHPNSSKCLLCSSVQPSPSAHTYISLGNRPCILPWRMDFVLRKLLYIAPVWRAGLLQCLFVQYECPCLCLKQRQRSCGSALCALWGILPAITFLLAILFDCWVSSTHVFPSDKILSKLLCLELLTGSLE